VKASIKGGGELDHAAHDAAKRPCHYQSNGG
jgi:hypothetical protein